MLSLPIFILSHENWVCILGISKKNHQFSLVFAKNLWSWTLDPIPYEKKKNQLWTSGHISGSRMNFWPDSILGGSLACREPKKTHIFMVQGPPLAEKFTKRGYSFSGPGTGPLDPLRVRLVFKGLRQTLQTMVWEMSDQIRRRTLLCKVDNQALKAIIEKKESTECFP